MAAKRRVVLCRGQYCNIGRRADALYRQLEPEIAAINDAAGERLIKLEIANCLDMCAIGPNLVIYPEREVFNGLDESALIELIERLKKDTVDDVG